MDYRVLNGLLVISSLLANTSAIGIDGKLDFGNSHSNTASFRSQNTNHKNSFVPVNTKVVKTEVSDNFDNIGVVCVSGGCNTTSTENTGKGIQTDVLVRVHTKVDLNDSNDSKTRVIEDTPDVPVVVGYRGSKLDTTIDEDEGRSLYPQSIYVPDSGPVSQPSYPSSYGTPQVHTYYSSSGGSSLTPSINSRVDSTSTLDHINPSITYEDEPPIISPLTPTVHTRVHSDSHKFYPSAKSGTFYVTKTDPNIGINVEPSVGVSTSGVRTDPDTKTNTIEVKIPYFEPAYHNHYYGENPPPQVVWYPKKVNSYNPVEFKTVKTVWTPSTWNRRVTPHSHVHSTSGGSDVQCTCKEGEKTHGARWYPSTNRGGINDPGSQINDKLAPLN